MAKLDRESFQMMMAELNAEEHSPVIVRSPFEDMEPDYEYMATVKNRS